MSDREIVEDEFRISVKKWKIPEIDAPEIFDAVLASSVSQTRTFFEGLGWSFSEDMVAPAAECGDPESEYENRLRTGVFYATKAYYEEWKTGKSDILVLDKDGNPTGEEA